MKKKNYVLTLCCVVLLLACSDDDAAPAKDKTPLLTSTDWKIVELRVDGKMAVASECFWSNVYIFSADGTYDVDNACPVLSPVQGGDWSFQSNQSEFTWDYEIDIPKSTVFEIITLDAEVFEIEANGGDDRIRFEAVK